MGKRRTSSSTGTTPPPNNDDWLHVEGNLIKDAREIPFILQESTGLDLKLTEQTVFTALTNATLRILLI